MLSQEEQNNARELLELVDTDDLLSVANINTNKLIKIKTRDEAIKAILLHESSYNSLLSRKKITRSVLFNYLHSKEITCEGTLDKSSLIKLIIDNWSQVKTVSTVPEVSHSSDDIDSKQDGSFAEALALQFSQWFYSKINEDFYKRGDPEISEADFWQDCQTIIHIPETPDSDSQDFSAGSAADSVLLIKSFRSQYDLYFSPNLNPEGVNGKCDPHGLVLVSVHGTLHSRKGVCVGLFRQVFGLIADPMSDSNYKIKKTTLFVQKIGSKTS